MLRLIGVYEALLCTVRALIIRRVFWDSYPKNITGKVKVPILGLCLEQLGSRGFVPGRGVAVRAAQSQKSLPESP